MNKEIRGSFQTKVTFKMICLYIWAWIIGGTITHKNILLERKEDIIN